MKKEQERKSNKVTHNVAEILPDQKKPGNIETNVVSMLSNLPSINGLFFIYKKTQANTCTLTKLKNLVRVYNEIEFPVSPSLVYMKNIEKIINLSIKLDQEENTAMSYLQHLEINWNSFSDKDRAQINRVRSVVIKNADKYIKLKQEIFCLMRNKENPAPADMQLLYVLSNNSSLNKFNDMLQILKEDLEKEEKIINEWLLTVNKELFNRGSYLEKDILQANDYLENHHRQSEWLGFYERLDEYYIHTIKSSKEINESQHRINLSRTLNDKIRNLSNKIYFIFSNKIEETRQKKIDRKKNGFAINKRRKVILPIYYRGAETFINFLIKNGLTPAIIFYFYGFSHPISLKYKYDTGTVCLRLAPELVESMTADNYYLHVSPYDEDLDKEIPYSIPFNLIIQVGCHESGIGIDFNSSINPSDLDIEYHKKMMSEFYRLKRMMKRLK